MKKNIFNLCMFIFLAGVLGFATSCSDDEGNEGYGPLSVDMTEYTFSSNEAGTAYLAVTSSTDWKVEVVSDWLTLPAGTVGYGTPGKAIRVSLTATENTDEQPRSAIVTFTNLVNPSETVSVTVTQPGHSTTDYTDTNASAPAGMQKNATGIFKEIYAGWNLGNTMESAGGETAWGNPETTQAMISAVKNLGFNAVRVPVRWYEHADDDMNIDPAWMARVKEIVDYAYNQGMYVILNSHHDNWYDRIVPGTLSETKEGILTNFNNMWTQIAEAFADYDEHLLFSGTNEVIYTSQGEEIWTEPTDQNLFDYLNDLNQTFVDAVRATGGNNAWRTVIVQPWACSPDFALAHFVKPDDTVENRLALEFHYYQPWNYCQQSGNDANGENMYFWGEPYAGYSYSTNTEADVLSMFGQLKYNFVDRGLPVIMGEYGAVMHQKTTANQSFGINYTLAEESRAYYLEFVVKNAKNHGFPAFFWDNNVVGSDGENFGLLNRETLEPYSQVAVDGIMRGAAAGVYPY